MSKDLMGDAQKLLDSEVKREEKQPRRATGIVEKKKSKADSFADILFSENPIDSIWELIKDEYRDALRDFFNNTVIAGLQRSTSRSGPRRSSYSRTSSVRSIDNPSYEQGRSEKRRSSWNDPGDLVDEIVVRDYTAWNEVYDILINDYLKPKGRITVNNLNDTIGRTGKSYNSSYYGWTSLDDRDIRKRPSDEGLIIILPKPIRLD